jgi:hypothetical protein
VAIPPCAPEGAFLEDLNRRKAGEIQEAGNEEGFVLSYPLIVV